MGRGRFDRFRRDSGEGGPEDSGPSGDTRDLGAPAMLFDQEEATEPDAESSQGSDPAARIRLAAENAAQAAEERAVDEIRALEEDLARAKSEAAQTATALTSRLADAKSKATEAESRASAAEARAREIQSELDAERADRAKALAEADRRVRDAEEHAREAESEAKRRAAEDRERQRAAEAEPDRRPGGADAVGEEALDDEEDVRLPPASGPPPEGSRSLNGASFDELRGLGMSITQAKRVLRFREKQPFTSIEELDEVPGFSRDFLKDMKSRTVP